MSPARHDYSEVVTYSQAHLRLKKDKGRPAHYACVTCGETAHEWAYMGGCPNEIDDGVHGKYSVDQDRYQPMCRPCHRRHDRASADGRSVDVCPKGHEWNAANTGLRVKRSASTGLRFCRACGRDSTRRWRLRNSRTT